MSSETVQAAWIEIIYADHVYTATVYDHLALQYYLDEEYRPFRFGHVTRFGSLDADELLGDLEVFSNHDCYAADLADPRLNPGCNCDDSGCDSCGTHGALCFCPACLSKARGAK